jgi:hypothetical protein
MNLFKKYYCLIPLLIICFQIFINLTVDFKPTINPSSDKNKYLQELQPLLIAANLNPLQYTINDSRQEIEFYLTNSKKQNFQVILSTQKSPLLQVTALQKLIKIANIKGKDIHFIDLSSQLRYATL